jgi:hypothetical protein
LAEVIKKGLASYHSAQRIYQDLVAEHQFSGGYDAVKRFVRRLAQRSEAPFRRMECAPGQELRVPSVSVRRPENRENRGGEASTPLDC